MENFARFGTKVPRSSRAAGLGTGTSVGRSTSLLYKLSVEVFKWEGSESQFTLESAKNDVPSDWEESLNCELDCPPTCTLPF